MRLTALLIPLLALLSACAAPAPEAPRAEIPQSLALDAPVTGRITAASAQDVWRLRLEERRTLRIKLLPEGTGETAIDGLRVSLFTPEGREIARREGQPGATVVLDGLAPGIYRVVVQGYKGATGAYRLTVRGLREIRSTPIQG